VDLRSEVYKFIDFLKEAGQTLWQTFPPGSKYAFKIDGHNS